METGGSTEVKKRGNLRGPSTAITSVGFRERTRSLGTHPEPREEQGLVIQKGWERCSFPERANERGRGKGKESNVGG